MIYVWYSCAKHIYILLLLSIIYVYHLYKLHHYVYWLESISRVSTLDYIYENGLGRVISNLLIFN